MAKINLNDIQSIYDLTFLNQNAADIESEFQNKVLYRDNPVGEPNQMENDLDMNSNRVLNLPKPTSNSEAARLADVQAGISGNQANLIEYNNSNVQEALDTRTVFVGSVADGLADYAGVADITAIEAAGYLPGVFALANPASRGGGVFIYSSATPKADHNGVTVFSPTVPKLSDQSGANQQEKRDAFIAGTGETAPAGDGCFLRIITDAVYSEWAGTYADSTNDDTVPLQATLDAAAWTAVIGYGEHITSAALTVDKPINIHGVGAERTNEEGSAIRNTGSGDALIYSQTVTIYDRTIKDLHITSVNGHALKFEEGVNKCEFLNLRLDSRSVDHSAVYGSFVPGQGGVLTCRFIGGDYFGANTVDRNVPIVNLQAQSTAINENVFRDMWVSLSKGAPAVSIGTTGGTLTNNRFEGVTFEVCEGGLIRLTNCSHSTILGCSAWDSPDYTANLIETTDSSSTVVINFGRIGGTPDPGVVDIKFDGGGANTVINYRPQGANSPAIDFGGGTGTYIGFVGSTDLQNVERVSVVSESITAGSGAFLAPDGEDAELSATSGGDGFVRSEHGGTTRSLRVTANTFFGGNGAVLPSGNEVLDLGGTSTKWKNVHAVGYRANGNAGVSGTFTTSDAKTVTVTNGIITSIV